MASPDFSVPQYLEPPTQAQQQQLDAQQEAARQKFISQMTSRLGMARLQSERQQLIAAGVDPQQAQTTALFRSAPAIFNADPEKALEAQAGAQAAMTRTVAQQRYKARLLELTGQGRPVTEAAPQAMLETPDMFATTRDMTSVVDTGQRVQAQRDVANIRLEGALDRDALKRSMDEQNLALRKQIEERKAGDAETQNRLKELQAGLAQEKEARQAREGKQKAQLAASRLVSSDKQLLEMRKELGDWQSDLARYQKETPRRFFGGRKQADIDASVKTAKDAIADLQRQMKEREAALRAEAGVADETDQGPAPAAAPSDEKVFDYDPKTRKLK